MTAAVPDISVTGPAVGGIYQVRYGEESYVGRVSDPPTAKLLTWLAGAGLDLARLIAVLPAAPAEPSAPPTRWWRRGMRELRGVAREAPPEDMAEMLLAELRAPAGGPDEIVEWEGLEWAALLDVDDIAGSPEALALRLVPAPRAWWLSHGGAGLHALYGPAGGWPAGELAAAAALAAAHAAPTAGLEVLPRTRLPASPRGGPSGPCGGPVIEGATDPGALARWLRAEAGPADAAAVEAWLAERGLERGGKYRHESCPGDPCPVTNQAPVVVGEDGVTCFRCRAVGRGGWWPWGRLVGGPTATEGPWTWLARAARSLAVASHAALILAEAAPALPPSLREPAYRALSRAACADPADPRVDAVGRDWRLVRGDGLWLDAETLAPVQPGVGVEVTRGMPSARWAVRQPDGTWEEGVDPIRHDRHRTDQPCDGYVAVRPLRGMRLWGQHRPYPGLPAMRVIAPTSSPNPARYVPPRGRMSRAEAEAVLEAQLPGLPWAYLRLLILARAYAESGAGPVPLVASTGPTGVGKTACVDLAVVMVGERRADVRHDDAAKFAEAVGTGALSAGVLLADEYAKGLRREERLESFSRLLDLRRWYTYRRLRVGPVQVPLDAVLVLTGTDLGEEIRGYAQVARRLVHVRLWSRVPDWHRTLRVGDVTRLRDDPVLAAAADAWVSDLVDRWFPPGVEDRGWFAAAEALGYPRLEEQLAAGAEGVPVEALVRELWEATPEAPDAGPPWVGAGWRVLDLTVGQGTRVYQAWAALCDGEHPHQFATIRRAKEVDLARALGVPGPLELDVAPHAGRLGFRWRHTVTGAIVR